MAIRNVRTIGDEILQRSQSKGNGGNKNGVQKVDQL